MRFNNGVVRVNMMSAVLVAGSLFLASAGFALARNEDGGRGMHRAMQRQLERMQFNEVSRSGGGRGRDAVADQVSRAASFSHRSFQQIDSGRLVNLRSGVDLHLGSELSNITLGGNLFEHSASVTIDVGGVKKTVTSGSQVTAAEYVAAKQMLAVGKQSVLIDASGKAVGGDVNLSEITSRHDKIHADDLTIPTDVAVYADFGKRSTFQLSGDLVNSGSLYMTSSRNSQRAGSFRADNITNESGALISTFSSDVLNAVDFTLHADDNLSNLGTIAGAGGVTLSAGNSVTNKSSVTANGALNVYANSINNSGALKSTNGDVTVDAPGALMFDNNGGSVSALNGAINVRAAGYSGSFKTDVFGGDLLSRELNVHAGENVADINVYELTGVVNETGLASHVGAHTENLSLGNICLTGDPTFKNATGNITLNGDIIVAEDLTIVALGNITNSVPLTIQAASDSAGFDITFAAGAAFVSGAGTDSANLAPPLPAGVAISLTGATSATGGSIILGTNAGGAVTISSRPTTNAGDGGDISFFAFRSAGNANGLVDLTGSTALSGGIGNGDNGTIEVIAGGLDAGGQRAIRTGSMSVVGGTGPANGLITLRNNQPTTTGGNINYNANGSLAAGGSFGADGSQINGAGIAINGNLTAFNSLSTTTGANSSLDVGEGVQITSLNEGIVALRGLGDSNITFAPGAFINSNGTVDVFLNGDGTGGSLAQPILTNAPFLEIGGTANSNEMFVRDTNTGLVLLNGNSSGGTLTLIVDGSIGDGGGQPLTSVNATIQSLNGSIGLGASAPLRVDGSSYTFNAAQSVFVQNLDAGATNLNGDSSAGKTFSLSAVQITGAPSIVADNINLTVSGTFSLSGGNLIAEKSLTMTNTANSLLGFGGANVETPVLNLVAADSVGLNVGTPFIIPTGVQSVSADAGTGVFIQGPADTKTFTLNGLTGLQVNVEGTANLLVNGNVTSTGGAVLISTATGKITVNPDVEIVSAADLSLVVSAPTLNAKKSIISLGNGSLLQTLNGEVLLSIGDNEGAVPGTAPVKNFGSATTNGGQIFFGTFGVTAKKAPVNTFFANTNQIRVNNPVKAKNILLNGGVNVITQ